MINLKEIVKPGVSTLEINDYCHKMIIENNATPAPLNYKGFPKSICTSVNHVVCHGIPSQNKILQDGDIINIDVTVILIIGMVIVQECMYSRKNKQKTYSLLQTTYECLLIGIKHAITW